MFIPDLSGAHSYVFCKQQEALVLDSEINNGCHRKKNHYTFFWFPVGFEREFLLYDYRCLTSVFEMWAMVVLFKF